MAAWEGDPFGPQSDGPLGQPLKIDATMSPGRDVYEVVLTGDVDVTSLEHLEQMMRPGLELGCQTILRLDGINVFGAAASRAIAELLQEASARSVDLSIRGAPSHVRSVFEIVGLSDERITHPLEPTGPLSPVVFDAVVAASALRTHEAVCVTNADPEDPRIVFVNEAFTVLTGYRADEVLGASPRLLQGPLTDRAVLDRLKRCLHESRDFSGEAVNYRADGAPFWMNWRVLRVGYGSHRYFMALQRDGTMLRQLSRHDAARTRLTRLVNDANPPPSRDRVLVALNSAVGSVIDPPDATISTALTTDTGALVASDLGRGLLEPDRLGTEQITTIESDGSATLHIPFPVATDLVGHIVVRDIHPDWVQLIDLDQVVQLGRDSAHALATANQ